MLKDALSTLEELDFDASEGEEDEDEEELDSEFSELDMDSDELDAMTEEEFVELQKKLMSKKKGRSKLELDDLEALLRDAERDLPDSDVDSDLSAEDVPLPPPKKQKKRKETSADEPAKKKRKTSSSSSAPVFDLEEPEFVPTSKKRASTFADPTDVYGDATTLASSDAADKQARRKTLRFHTSKIESAVARRAGARQALGGDDDVPYKERRREAERRKEREAKERGAVGGADLDDEEPAAAPKRSRGDGDEGDGADEDDGYYSLIKKQKKEKKEAKKAEHEAAQAAARYVSVLRLLSQSLTYNPSLARRSWTTPKAQTALAVSLAQSSRTAASHPIVVRASAIRVSRSARSTTRPRRSWPVSGRCIRRVRETLRGMRERRAVLVRSLRVSSSTECLAVATLAFYLFVCAHNLSMLCIAMPLVHCN
jgi:hypothetical protein